MLKQDGNRLLYTYDAETLSIEPWAANGLRVRATKMATLPQMDWALLPQASAPQADIALHEGYATITNGKITAALSSNGKLTFTNSRGEVILQEYVRTRRPLSPIPGIDDKAFTSALELEAREFRPILGGDYALTARFEADPQEQIYGLGQYQQPYLNQKGCVLELAHRNSQASVPFAVSNRGYGFLWNNPAVGRVSLGKNVTTWEAMSTTHMDYWVTAGDTPAEIMSNYASATGTVPMMPDWAMGFWQCKLRYQTQDELLTIAREYKRRGVPLSVIVIDFFHWPCQGEWKFDPEYWPDPQAMVDELKAMGVALMVSVWPTVDPRSENFAEMEEKGYLMRTDRGLRIVMDFEGNTIHYDATNPGARQYLWDKAKANYGQYGIKAFWLDVAEPEYSCYDYDLYRYSLGSGMQVGNIYPLMYAQTFYEGMQADGQTNVLNLLRCAWAGSQRYGALVWSGDIDSSFRSLRDQLAAGLNMGLSGIPWWTTDIGGFHGGNPSDPLFRECFTRWFQFGTFCPVMRLHGSRQPFTEPLGTTGGGKFNSGGPNEIWSYGDDIYAICKDYIDIRMRILPYVKTLMAQAHAQGTPPMRPLFFDYPADAAAWQVEDQYMFGPDLLVAPVMHEDVRSRSVYLPAGETWLNAWTDEAFPGGQTIQVDAPIEQIPLFIRKGAALSIRE